VIVIRQSRDPRAASVESPADLVSKRDGRTIGEKHPTGAILSPAAPVVVAFRKRSIFGVTQAELAEEKRAKLAAAEAAEAYDTIYAALRAKIERGDSIEPGPLQVTVTTRQIQNVFIHATKGKTQV
jgi:hypothetical protein